MHQYTAIAAQIIFKEKVVVCERGHGSIDDAHLVTTDINDETNFVLQRIHPCVGRQPKLIMLTMSSFPDYRQRRADDEAQHWIVLVESPADPSVGFHQT